MMLLAAAVLYVGALTEASVTLVWGDPAQPGNSIGQAGAGLGKVTVELGGTKVETSSSFATMQGLAPDTRYPYRVSKDGKLLFEGTVRTWPKQAQRLIFFVIGDWGNGTKAQYELAFRMERERLRLRERGDEVRFVMSVGDNIYGLRNGGADDKDWVKKFFQPYGPTLREIPFYMVLGNHDGNESESREDLATQLDNTFTPGGVGQRWYHFQYGGMAEFFALDSTRNTESGPPTPAFGAEGPQSVWLTREMAKVKAPWRLVVQHHPMFTAGPDHPPFAPEAPHWLALYRKYGVQAVFAGHEHNLQFSEQNATTGGTLYVVSGSGGQLRAGSVRSKMAQRNIAAWAPQRQFLIVEMDKDRMQITPVSEQPLRLTGPDGKEISVPIEVKRISLEGERRLD